MNGSLTAPGYPERDVRDRARRGRAAAFPPAQEYGLAMYGEDRPGPRPARGSDVQPGLDRLDALRIVPPILMPERLEKLIELGREPLHTDVETGTDIGGFRSPLPLYVSALGSTRVSALAVALSTQAGRLGLPMVIGENIVPTTGYGRLGESRGRSVAERIAAYCRELPDAVGGVAVQQSTEDADAEVWNLAYSDPGAERLLADGRLAFELKVGQGAKPGLGGITVLDHEAASAVADRFCLDPVYSDSAGERGGAKVLRYATPGTFTAEILRHQVHMMRNNYPRAKVWVKLHPGRDVAEAARIAWDAGADAVTVDGAEGGTGWAPVAFLGHVGLPLAECLFRLAGHRAVENSLPGDGLPGNAGRCLLASGRMWEGARVFKALALGARAAGLGRAAFLAVDEDPERGLERLVGCLDQELRMLTSAVGKYRTGRVGPEDVAVAWTAGSAGDSHLGARLGLELVEVDV